MIILRNGTRIPYHFAITLGCKVTGLSLGYLSPLHCLPFSKCVPSLEQEGGFPRVGRLKLSPPHPRYPFCSLAPGSSVCQALGRDLMETALWRKVIDCGSHWVLEVPKDSGIGQPGCGSSQDMEQTRGGSWGPFSPVPCPRAFPSSWASTLCQGSCLGTAGQGHSLPRPWFFFLEITGLLCQVPAPACLPAHHHQLGLPPAPDLD